MLNCPIGAYIYFSTEFIKNTNFQKFYEISAFSANLTCARFFRRSLGINQTIEFAKI
jgi:hypothetical protein